jgi:hypothetical protein
MKIGLRKLHAFVTKKLPSKLLRRYKNFEILNESDLQFEVTRELRLFLRRDSEKGRLEVHGCLSCLDSKVAVKTYPDIVVMHRRKPWVVIELKESGRAKQLTAQQERDKIQRQRVTLSAKRGYFLYLARWGKHRTMRELKGPFGFWFYEVPVTLERGGMSAKQIKEFQAEFRKRAKYISALD